MAAAACCSSVSRAVIASSMPSKSCSKGGKGRKCSEYWPAPTQQDASQHSTVQQTRCSRIDGHQPCCCCLKASYATPAARSHPPVAHHPPAAHASAPVLPTARPQQSRPAAPSPLLPLAAPPCAAPTASSVAPAAPCTAAPAAGAAAECHQPILQTLRQSCTRGRVEQGSQGSNTCARQSQQRAAATAR